MTHKDVSGKLPPYFISLTEDLSDTDKPVMDCQICKFATPGSIVVSQNAVGYNIIAHWCIICRI